MPTPPAKPVLPTSKFAQMAGQLRAKAAANPVALQMWLGAKKAKKAK